MRRRIFSHVRFFVVAANYYRQFLQRLYKRFSGRYTILSTYFSPSGSKRKFEILFWVNA